MNTRRTSSRSGFTLIELLLVVVIIGILAAIVIPKLTGRTQEAEIRATEMQITSIQNALDHFERDCGRFPTGAETLAALIVMPALPNPDRWKGPYLRANDVPLDAWQQPFMYIQPGGSGPNDYDIYSVGPDLQAGTADDVRRK